MARDLEIIKKVKKQLGIILREINLDEIFPGNFGFALDNNQAVVGLSLYGLDISDLSPLVELTNLTLLDIGNTQVIDLSPLRELKNLAKLDLRYTRVRDLSPLRKLKNLTHLNLNHAKVGDLSSLGELINLKELHLSSTKVSDLSPLVELTNLTLLDIGNTQVIDLSPLRELKNLLQLNLRDTQVSDLSQMLGLKNLRTLDLRNNKITQLPAEVLDYNMEIKWEYDYKGGIYLDGNPLEEPPVEIVKQGKDAVRTYFASLEGEKRALNEVKVLLVGDGAAGKTSLVKRLLEQGFDKNEPQTHGININHWEVKHKKDKIKVNIWDFGGQEIMHATHQFFLSKRSLYVLVLDGRKDEKTEYWLNHIKSFGGDSSVIVVLNKIDENPGFDVNRRFLMEKYPNIKGFFPLSCATGIGIDKLVKALEIELAGIELIRTTWPLSWFNVKEQLEKMTEHFISYVRYREICAVERIDADAMDTLVEFLNDLGVILHFKEFHLEDTHVLEPKWLTNAVYKIINSKQLSSGKGVLELWQMGEILKPQLTEKTSYVYPPDKYRFIFQLMKKFELCYSIEEEEKILVPDLLEVGEPAIEFDYAGALKFRVCYNFLPRSVMPRFIVRRHPEIKGKLRWRTGVVLENKGFNAEAVVKSDHQAKAINIFVGGSQVREYLAVILNTLRYINGTFKKIEAKECVPLPDNPEIAVSYKHLIWLEQQGIESYAVEDTQNLSDVRQLLGAVDKTVFNQLLTGVKNIFLSMEKNEPQKRGYDFEKLLNQLFNLFGLAPRKPFRIEGEQIDGSFQLGNDIFLLEAKWKKEPLSKPDLVIFNDKVNSKPKWTRGLLVSISGFTVEAVKGFKLGRTTAIIGMDRQDLELILMGHISLEKAIRLELRHAGETNDFYAPLEELISLYHPAVTSKDRKAETRRA